MIFEKEGQKLSVQEFEKKTGTKWYQGLEFENEKILYQLKRKCRNLHEKGELTIEQIWLGKYYRNEIHSCEGPKLAIRFIDSEIGWGVFALQDLKKMQFIAEYSGKVRKKSKSDEKNSYCFEYVVCPGFATPYTIDAQDQGGVARYINHSEDPNLSSGLATFEDLTHVVLFAKEPIASGTQLCYHYGPDYWAKRKAPRSL